MAGLFSKQSCLSCNKQTRFPFLRMWIHIKECNQLYCSETCLWQYGEVLHRRRLEAIRAMAQYLVDDATADLAKIDNLAVKSQTALSEAKAMHHKAQITIGSLNKATWG